MVLCDVEIQAALECGTLKIEPKPDPRSFTTTAVDLHLSDEFMRWKQQAAGANLVIDPAADGFSLPVAGVVVIYSKSLAARRRGVSVCRMHRSVTPVPDSRITKSTVPPGPDTAQALEAFEQRIKERDEQTARLENLARVYGFAAVR